MKTYWDASALVDVILKTQTACQAFDRAADKVTRCHTLAEAFSILTGGRLGWRMLPRDASKTIRELAEQMTIVSLSSTESLKALAQAHARGVRGGAIHDFLHACAAEWHGCKQIITLNTSDFRAVSDLRAVAP